MGTPHSRTLRRGSEKIIFTAGRKQVSILSILLMICIPQNLAMNFTMMQNLNSYLFDKIKTIHIYSKLKFGRGVRGMGVFIESKSAQVRKCNNALYVFESLLNFDKIFKAKLSIFAKFRDLGTISSLKIII